MYERDGVKHRVAEVRADPVRELDRAERRAEAELTRTILNQIWVRRLTPDPIQDLR